MAIDVALLKIEAAVFHQVPTRTMVNPDGSQAQPIVATVESSLDTKLRFFLRDRLERAFKGAAQPIVRDDDASSPTPDLVAEGLATGAATDIVTPFGPLPHLLLAVQAHNSPQGLLSIVRGTCGAAAILAVLKVEQERGLSFETRIQGDEVSVEVAIEEGLVLTDKTELFKSALFYLDNGELAGYVTDDQTGSVFRGPSSEYWLREFLGCRYQRDFDVMTRSWIKATERLIKSDIADAAGRDYVLTAMLTELGANRNDIDPRRFIDNYVPDEYKDAAVARLAAQGAPTTRFRKSRDVSDQAPKKKVFVFTDGTEVKVPTDVSPELSTEEVDGEQLDVLTIRGHIRTVRT
jgi:hypothetical protein